MRAEVARLTADVVHLIEERQKYWREAEELRAEVARLMTERDEARSMVRYEVTKSGDMALCHAVHRWDDATTLPVGPHPTIEFRPEDSAAFADDGGSIRKETD